MGLFKLHRTEVTRLVYYVPFLAREEDQNSFRKEKIYIFFHYTSERSIEKCTSLNFIYSLLWVRHP